MMFNSWPQTVYQQSLQPVLPASLAKHPQHWTNHEVGVWLKWCSDEYCIECVPPEKLDMNGKALCLLCREDFIARVPKNGDILYNALQKLIQRNAGSIVCSPVPAYQNMSTPSTGSFPPSQFQPKQIDNFSHAGFLVFNNSSSAPTNTVYSQPKISSRPLVPILPQVSNKLSGLAMHPEINLPTVSSVPGVLSPAPSADTDEASEEGSLSDPDELEKKNEVNEAHDAMSYIPQPIPPSALPTDNSHIPMLRKDSDCRLLWEFIHQLLLNPQQYSGFVCWENPQEFVFRIIHPTGLAQLWGHQKNRTNMTYEKLSRALRYYYRMNIIKKVSGRRLTYQFLQPPSNIQKGQRGAKPHSKTGPPPPPPPPEPENLKEENRNDFIQNEDTLPSSMEVVKSEEYPVTRGDDHKDHFNAFNTSVQCDIPTLDSKLSTIICSNLSGDSGCLSPSSGSNRTSPYSPSPLLVKSEDIQAEPEDLSMATMFKRRPHDDFKFKRENGNRLPVKVEFKNLNS